MPNTNDTAADDASIRFSLLDLGGPSGSTSTSQSDEAAPALDVTPEASEPVQALDSEPAGMSFMERVEAARARTAKLAAEGRAAVRAERNAATDLATEAAPVMEALGVDASLAPSGAERILAGQLTGRDLIAGAAAAGQGVLVGWGGAGELTRGQIVAALESAGLPVEWAPASKSAKAQAAKAADVLTSDGFLVRADRDFTKTRVGGQRSRWTAGRISHGAATGEAFGRIVTSIVLRTDDSLQIEGEGAERILAEYKRLRDGEIFGSADITEWLRGALRTHLRAVKLGGNFYIPRKGAGDAERLCEAVKATGWGTDWTLPALPIASSGQLQRGLADGIKAEAAAVLVELATARAALVGTERTEVGGRAAATLLAKLRTVGERAKDYSVLIGSVMTKDVRNAIMAAVAIVEPLADDTAQRGWQLEMD